MAGWQDILFGAFAGLAGKPELPMQRREQEFRQMMGQQQMNQATEKLKMEMEQHTAEVALRKAMLKQVELGMIPMEDFMVPETGQTPSPQIKETDLMTGQTQTSQVPVTDQPIGQPTGKMDIQASIQKLLDGGRTPEQIGKVIPILELLRKTQESGAEGKPLSVGGKGIYTPGKGFEKAPWGNEEEGGAFVTAQEAQKAIEKMGEAPKGFAWTIEQNAKGRWQVSTKSTKPLAEVNVDVGPKSLEEVGKKMADAVVTEHKDAQQSYSNLQSMQQAKKLLSSGMITGAGAEYIVGAGKALQTIGFNVGKDAISNTEAFASMMGRQVGQIIKAFGSGTGLSDADREYAEKIAGGKITLTKQSIEKIIAINEKGLRNSIKSYNARAKQVMGMKGSESLPYSLIIDVDPKLMEETETPISANIPGVKNIRMLP